jgi:catalase (peroxidase I)
VWDFVAKDLVELFTAADGTCNSFARAAVRLGFHDAGTWSKTSEFGGADGSLLLTNEEILQGENSGLAVIRTAGRGILNTYAPFGVGAADLVQFMHNVATVVCPLGPRQITFVGRLDNNAVNPRLLPDTRASADSLIQLFAEKTMTVIDLISLIGAHTTATQSFVDPAKAGQPLDSTPGVWDVEFYKECLAGAPPRYAVLAPFVKAVPY